MFLGHFHVTITSTFEGSTAIPSPKIIRSKKDTLFSQNSYLLNWHIAYALSLFVGLFLNALNVPSMAINKPKDHHQKLLQIDLDRGRKFYALNP